MVTVDQIRNYICQYAPVQDMWNGIEYDFKGSIKIEFADDAPFGAYCLWEVAYAVKDNGKHYVHTKKNPSIHIDPMLTEHKSYQLALFELINLFNYQYYFVYALQQMDGIISAEDHAKMSDELEITSILPETVRLINEGVAAGAYEQIFADSLAVDSVVTTHDKQDDGTVLITTYTLPSLFARTKEHEELHLSRTLSQCHNSDVVANFSGISGPF